MTLLSRWSWVLLIVIVVIIQFSLLKVILNNGFTADDWLLLFDYKTIGFGGNFLDKLLAIFYVKGIYTTYEVVYIGILESLFKGNYEAYQITNIIFKILATLSLYPLILVVFKRRLLAFLTTILYAVSYSSAGALQFVVKGSDYLGIFFMNIFLISYYLSFKTKKRFLLLTTVLLFLAFIFSPIRIYPLLLFTFLAEVIIWVKLKGLFGLITASLRSIVLFFPFLMLLLLSIKSTGHYLNGPLVVYQFLSYGNYQLLLTPFAGLGYTFLTNDWWRVFGSVTFVSFKDYLLFLARGPLIIYTLLTIALGFLIIKRPLLLILGIILTNLVFEIISYFFITNLRLEVGPNIKSFYSISTYAVFLGFYVISLAVSSLLIWLRNHKSNILLLSLFIGPIFSSVFLWGTWLIIGVALTFKEGIHWYLVIPPIGSSLFLASLMVMGFDRIKMVVNARLGYILISSIFLMLLSLYLVSSKEINTTFIALTNIGYGAFDQEQIKSKLLSQLKFSIDGQDTLFYLDTSEDLQTPDVFYPVTLISAFEERMHFRNWEVVNGCVGVIYDKATLEKSVVIKDGVKGFKAGSLCLYDYSLVERTEIFYSPDSFYAFKLKNKDFIDIKKIVLQELGF